jgi:hypothetical protein
MLLIQFMIFKEWGLEEDVAPAPYNGFEAAPDLESGSSYYQGSYQQGSTPEATNTTATATASAESEQSD